MRSRCVPSWNESLQQVKEVMEKTEKRGGKKLLNMGIVDMPSIEWDPTAVEKEWKKVEEKKSEAVRAEEIRELKRFLGGLVVAPVDKNSAEAAII